MGTFVESILLYFFHITFKIQTKIRYEPIDLSNHSDVSDLDFWLTHSMWKKPMEKNNKITGNDHFSRHTKLEIYFIIKTCTVKVSPPKVAERNFMSKGSKSLTC